MKILNYFKKEYAEWVATIILLINLSLALLILPNANRNLEILVTAGIILFTGLVMFFFHYYFLDKKTNEKSPYDNQMVTIIALLALSMSLIAIVINLIIFNNTKITFELGIQFLVNFALIFVFFKIKYKNKEKKSL